jgi:hypothetical protein
MSAYSDTSPNNRKLISAAVRNVIGALKQCKGYNGQPLKYSYTGLSNRLKEQFTGILTDHGIPIPESKNVKDRAWSPDVPTVWAAQFGNSNLNQAVNMSAFATVAPDGQSMVGNRATAFTITTAPPANVAAHAATIQKTNKALNTISVLAHRVTAWGSDSAEVEQVAVAEYSGPTGWPTQPAGSPVTVKPKVPGRSLSIVFLSVECLYYKRVKTSVPGVTTPVQVAFPYRTANALSVVSLELFPG